MCHVSPGASSPVIFELRRTLPIYGFLGLNLFTTTPSSCFLCTFSTLAGGACVSVSVVTWALMETTLPLVYCNGTWKQRKEHNPDHNSTNQTHFQPQLSVGAIQNTSHYLPSWTQLSLVQRWRFCLWERWIWWMERKLQQLLRQPLEKIRRRGRERRQWYMKRWWNVVGNEVWRFLMHWGL